MENELKGRFWIGRHDRNFLGKGRVELLKNIDKTGSISKAAKAMKMSYKAAWDAVDAMSNLAEHALVERVTGGRGGGGTRLTPYGKEVVKTFCALEEEYEMMLRNLSSKINGKAKDLRLADPISLPLSARNQLSGNIVSIENGDMSSDIVIALEGGQNLMATITKNSLKKLGIEKGSKVFALFKANSLMLSNENTNIDAKIANRFQGKVEKIEHGETYNDVIVAIEGGIKLCSQMRSSTLLKLNLDIGSSVTAFCRAEDIMIGAY